MANIDFSLRPSPVSQWLYRTSLPSKVKEARLILWNDELAKDLKLDDWAEFNRQELANYFVGNQALPGASPVSLAYCGHQFGHFSGLLGDGRAHLVGQVLSSSNSLMDLQLKGSGPTSFSRGGDGRCGLAPALREFLMGEALYSLGVPTTRSLSVVATGEMVWREQAKPGAVVCRVASSHIRVGSFQYLAMQQNLEGINHLVDHSIDRHFPSLQDEMKQASTSEKALALLDASIEGQIGLVLEWMRVGFIHGVLNTDNTMISGESLDFGPCAMMSRYEPLCAFSSIDRNGRYAFANQANILRWNMARLAECLLPVIDSNVEQAIALVEPLINDMQDKYHKGYVKMMRAKLGLNERTSVAEISNDFSEKCGVELMFPSLLNIMEEQKLDYTQTFSVLQAYLARQLGKLDVPLSQEEQQVLQELGPWPQAWLAGLKPDSYELALQLMQEQNPEIIPRNHLVENALVQAEKGDLAPFKRLLNAVKNAYCRDQAFVEFRKAPADGDQNYKTFCGT